MISLYRLVQVIDPVKPCGPTDLAVGPLAYDSRAVEPGGVFFAIPGEKADGHRFIDQAIGRGARVVVGSQNLNPAGTIYLQVADARLALAQAAHEYYGQPTARLDLIGVTGTSGKTTVSYAVESILKAAGLRPGVIGTVNYRHGDRVYPAPTTTPQSLDLARMLDEMAIGGCRSAVMEVSSHALIQHRISGCRFRTAAFLNLSRDHLDYHHDMEDYFRAKRRLLTDFDLAARGLVGLDDPFGRRLKTEQGDRVLTFGLDPAADFTAVSAKVNGTGLEAEIITPSGSFRLKSPLLGRFNLLNLLAAAGLAWLAGIEPRTIAAGLTDLAVVPGRLEDVGRAHGRRVVVDYAHKPDALIKVMKTARDFTAGRLITVFGCGGDRDQGKRPLMGRAALEGSDVVVVTSDNPRSEDPLAIIDDILAGMTGADRFDPADGSLPEEDGWYAVLPDRREAIRAAVAWADPGDTVLICGKGHEDYQLIGAERLHLDDREEARAALEAAEGGRP